VCLLLVFFNISTLAQTKSEKLSVLIDITSFSDDSVSFAWNNFSISSTDIYRKKISATTWSTLQTSYSGTTYTDNTFDTAVAYEYKFQVNTGVSTPPTAYGYIAFGVKVPEANARGNILLLVDDRFMNSLSVELSQLQRDLLSDGWNPTIAYTSKDSSVSSTKSIIDGVNTSSNLSAIYLIGHIPVPYSGRIAPDGHADHEGAWPSDLFYASNASSWTDNSINHTNTYRTANENTPSDGKYDRSRIQEEINCPISRVDFYNLPASLNSEEDMLRNYLIEASKYKNGALEVKDAGLVDNQIVNHYEGFAANGFRNFGSLFEDSISQSNMMSSLENDTYKWTYAVGYGSDSSMSGIGSVSDIHNSDFKGIFSMTFGSYFGDWNTEDNLMRSMLANGKMLTTCWAGRPNWFFHHMGLNNPIALSTEMSIENDAGWTPMNTTKYEAAGYGQNNVHMSLLGDLTLRQNYNSAIDNFVANYNVDSNYIEIAWDKQIDENVISYEIYKSTDSLSGYTLLQSFTPLDSSYIDVQVDTVNYYYIKYVSLDSTASGSYYNNSLGNFMLIDTSIGTGSIAPVPVTLMTFTAEAVKNNGHLKWSTASEHNFSHFEIEKSLDANNWTKIDWVEGQGNSFQVNEYTLIDYDLDQGNTYYRLRMVDYDQSYEYSEIAMLKQGAEDLVIYPNPSSGNKVIIKTKRDIFRETNSEISVSTTTGMPVPFEFDQYTGELTIKDAKGIYFVKTMGVTKSVVFQ
jgi:hypothetical protein